MPVVSVASSVFLDALGGADHRALVQDLTAAQSGLFLAICHDLRRRPADIWSRLTGATLLPFLEAVLASSRPDVLSVALPVVEILTSDGVVRTLDGAFQQKLPVCVLKFYNSVWPHREENPTVVKMAVVLLTAVANSPHCLRVMVCLPDFKTVVHSAADPDPRLVHVNWQLFAKIAHVPDVFILILKEESTAILFTEAVESKDPIVLGRFLELSTAIFSQGRVDIVEAFSRAMTSPKRAAKVALLYKGRQTFWKDHKRIMTLIENFAKAATARVAPGVQEFLEEFERHLQVSDATARTRGKGTVRKALTVFLESPSAISLPQ
jgi:hypothetical protein